jgi:hypothetical protein
MLFHLAQQIDRSNVIHHQPIPHNLGKSILARDHLPPPIQHHQHRISSSQVNAHPQ